MWSQSPPYHYIGPPRTQRHVAQPQENWGGGSYPLPYLTPENERKARRMENIYYSPEKHGLTIAAEVDFGGSCEFDMYVVWKDKDGLLYFGHDSGCSCPSPFDDTADIHGLERITSVDPVRSALGSQAEGAADFLREVEVLCK